MLIFQRSKLVKLTGLIKFRKNWTGATVLQVQYFYLYDASGYIKSALRWRDAYLEDIKFLPNKVEIYKDV